jgi:hypothetical protein
LLGTNEHEDGDYICSIVCGDSEIVSTGIVKGGNVQAAKQAVEIWMEEKAKIVRGAVERALTSTDHG